MMVKVKKNSFFVNGPITLEKITKLITKLRKDISIGACDIFLGQVRADSKSGSKKGEHNKVSSIIYSAYKEMAEEELNIIYYESIHKYNLKSLHILHSLGKIMTGEISLLVMVSSAHRVNCFNSIKFIVDQIKKRVPIWKKEVYKNGSYRWI